MSKVRLARQCRVAAPCTRFEDRRERAPVSTPETQDPQRAGPSQREPYLQPLGGLGKQGQRSGVGADLGKASHGGRG